MRSHRAGLALLSCAILAVAILSCGFGRYAVPPVTVVEIMASRLLGSPAHWLPQAETVVMTVRLPRIMAAMLVGMALSASGAAYQGLFRNPLVSPDILGVSAGAGLGASTAILFGFGPAGVQVAAFALALVAVLATYAIASRSDSGNGSVLLLILSGIVIGAFFTALISAIKYIADPDNALMAITYWLLGGLSSVGGASLLAAAVPILVGFAVLMALRWNLDVMVFGEEEARALGVNTAVIRAAIILAATLMTGAAVAISGVVGLVGLVVPHMARAMFGPNFSILIPGSALLGALFVLVMDDIARTALAMELPLGVLTEIVGAPVFLFLLNRSRRAWA